MGGGMKEKRKRKESEKIDSKCLFMWEQETENVNGRSIDRQVDDDMYGVRV